MLEYNELAEKNVHWKDRTVTSATEAVPNTQTVFIIDDEPDVLRSLEDLLSASGFKTEAYSSADQFLRNFDSARRGCALIDLNLQSMSGIALLQRLRSMGGDLPAILFSGAGTVPEVAESMRGGAIDFLQKPLHAETLCQRIQEAFRKDDSQRQERVRAGELRLRMRSLSPREREVAALVVDGMTAKQIAQQLGIETKTVEVHRSRLVRKSGFESTLEFVRDLACFGIRSSDDFRVMVQSIAR